MQREGVVRHLIHTFKDINLAVLRPVRPDGPEGWPCSTSEGHVLNIQHDETTVVFLLAFYPDARTSLGRYILEVYTPLHGGG